MPLPDARGGRRARWLLGLRWHYRAERSLVLVPALYVVAAIAASFALPHLDELAVDALPYSTGAGTARDILTATGMIAFTGVVVASTLVAVQFAAGQYSPRLVLWFRSDAVVKHALGMFVAVSLFCLAALFNLEGTRLDYQPDLTVTAGALAFVASMIAFAMLLQRVTDTLRPRRLLAAVAGAGARAAADIHPALRAGEARDPDPRPDGEGTVVLVHRGAPGVVTALDRGRLVALAIAHDAVVEVVPMVGETVLPGNPVVRAWGGRPDGRAVARCVLITEERTIEQDPGFALRIVVDVGIRALSPAVNDPTTAVHCLDAIEALLGRLAGLDLDGPVLRGADGRARVMLHASDWSALVGLALDELRHYGAGSVQVARRMQALLDALEGRVPEERLPALAARRTLLERAVAAAFPDPAERALARHADRLGLGGGPSGG